ncbi:ADP-ribosylglycohydrolase family protein [Tropicibacter sp. R16_0]|uniref:ADP-ribosylglycohydrolase family protein n=1 Tax=Tropicibacter sp. R16_0 TaxID=2821102 RepID=UPI001ADA61FA|nr:ADP-ribosylglycohydrolase family protein [Tropicibacter sp. R16_0]MBO9448783.1 ADP-ribosylglycohydrolase family protein [Tropicibacter sp. R16_0]
MPTELQLDRACGALAGVAIGDALGMPSQTLSREDIARHYGVISDFMAPFPDHPVSHGLQAAQVTDDTEQTFLLANRLITDGGRVDETRWANDLLAWEEDIRARGLRDLLGPSSKAALDAILAGSPAEETGRNGTTNGAAMRIAPIGIATPFDPMSRFIDSIEMACRMTHNTGEAIAGAAAVAAVISCGIDGLDFDDAIETALQAAAQAQDRGFPVGHLDMHDRIAKALDVVGNHASEKTLAETVGTSVASCESVAAAFGVVRLAGGDPWEAAKIAANIGDDTDTIGAIAGAMAGACVGLKAIHPDAVKTVRDANDLPIEATAAGLLALRADGEAPANGKMEHAS